MLCEACYAGCHCAEYIKAEYSYAQSDAILSAVASNAWCHYVECLYVFMSLL